VLLSFTIAAASGIGSGAVSGIRSGSVGWRGLLLFPAVLSGNYLGAKAFGKVSDTVWRAFVMLVLGIIAVGTIVPVLTN
jgi:hypothetical protein